MLLQVRLVILGDVEQGLHVRAGQGTITAQGVGMGWGWAQLASKGAGVQRMDRCS